MAQDLEAALATMKQEIDSLQVQTRHFIKPWYREGASLVSALALMFSFGTTGVSYFQAKETEAQAHRTELRELILKLGRSPREMFEFQQRFRNDSQSINSFSALLNQENSILAKQASEIVWRIPERVSASEHLAVGTALMQSTLLEPAKRHFLAAAEKANDYNEAVGAYRSIGYVAFQVGDVVTGRENYGLAKTVLRSGRIGVVGNLLIDFSDAVTEIRWAQAEASQGNCQEFAAHLDAAGRHLAALPVFTAAPLQGEAGQVRQQGCPPAAYVPPVPAGEGGTINASTP